jgi:quinol monooxygenase YgiN
MLDTDSQTADQPTGSVVSTIRIPATPGCEEDVIVALRSVVGPSLANRTCGECRVLRDVADECFVVFYERWLSFAAFERHVRSELYLRVLAAIDMAAEPPKVRIECMEHRWDLDLVKELRMKSEKEP